MEAWAAGSSDPGAQDRAFLTGDGRSYLVRNLMCGEAYYGCFELVDVNAPFQPADFALVDYFGNLLSLVMPHQGRPQPTEEPLGPLRDLLVDGVIGGVGAVIVFLPNIMILYLFISFMEDSGYLARAAFIMDRVMHRIGVHGKSFIPLIMGFGCNVPAIMACRTIESRSSRLITILITPFMSCSARIPIYLLLAGTFFAADAGTVMLGLYALGIVLAVVTARLMRRFLFPVDETPFGMELPPYRLPTWKTTFSHMWDKCAQYLKKMGGMILIASVIVWFLSYYPRTDAAAGTEAHYENSYLGRLGKGCEPVFSPLGFNWKAGVSLLSGLPAKEIVVSTLGVLYSEGAATAPAEQEAVIGGADGATEIIVKTDDPTPAEAFRTAEEEEADSLSQRLLASGDFTTASALAFLVFILLYNAPHALHRHGGRHRRRSRVEMGCGVGGLQHDAGLVRGVDRISDRTDILNDELAGLHRRGHRAGGCGHRREAAVVFRARTAAGRMRVVRVGAMPAQEAHRQELICRTRAAPGRFSE